MCSKGRLRGSLRVCNGGAATPPNPPAFLKPIRVQQNTSIMSSPCLLLGKVARILVFANGGGCAPPNPPAFVNPIHACNKNTNIMSSPFQFFCSKGRLRGSLCVCKGGWLRPPPTPPALKPIHACNKTQASCRRCVCCWGRLPGSLCLQMGVTLARPLPMSVQGRSG